MEKKDLEYFKNKLEKEKIRLEKELATVGHINPDNPKDWESDPGDISNERDVDPNVQADNFEEYENRTAILKQLEIQLGDVNKALGKIKEGKYGVCEVSGEEISKERLEANPAARTCSEHMGE